MTAQTLWHKLREPFAAEDLEWRAQKEGAGSTSGKPYVMCVCYITNRAIMQRLDAVVGPENWKNEFRPGPGGQPGSVTCGISIRVTHDDAETEWITKWDGADSSDIEPVKGGLSDAMKRAAVQWGIGRYLYDVDATWGEIVADKTPGAKRGKSCSWLPPKLPARFLPKIEKDGGAAPKTRREIELEAEVRKLRGQMDAAAAPAEGEPVEVSEQAEPMNTAEKQARKMAGPPTLRLMQAIDAELVRIHGTENAPTPDFDTYGAAFGYWTELKIKQAAG